MLRFPDSFKLILFLKLIVLNYVQTCNPNEWLLASVNVETRSQNSNQRSTLTPYNGISNATIKIEASDQVINELCYGSIKDLINLHHLELDNNQIKEVLPGCFQNLPKLGYLGLGNNNIEVLEEEVFNLLNVTALKLSNNQINYIYPRAFDNMTQLQQLDLSSNKLQRLNSEWFKNCRDLTSLNLEDNLIVSIPAKAFGNLIGKRNTLQMEILLDINLNRNKISSIDRQAFHGLDGLGSLILDSNEIHHLDVDLFRHFKYFMSFSIESNKLDCLPNDLSGILVANETNALDSNPWNCTCLDKIREYSERRLVPLNARFSIRTCTDL